LHLTIYSRLNNPFVTDLLEAYWDAYETVGLNVYSEFEYLERVWSYHQEMVEAILVGDFDRGYHALVEHIGMLHYRPELGENIPKSRLGRSHKQTKDN
jgi:DNA-binding GntR family transcriptional regulator